MTKFRLLRKDEIDCRVNTINEKGLTLLFYKDARCDMNILDETVGAMNWQRSHCRNNANCIVSIWDDEKKQWISKEDTGTESYTEKEKGLASDSFKRACFNWGIGRELYTAPFVYVPASKCKIENKNGKLACFDKFIVSSIEYKEGVITDCTVYNMTQKCEAFSMKRKQEDEGKKITDDPPKIDVNDELHDFILVCSNCGAKITQAEHDWSVKRYKRPLCRACQKLA